jgi:hypothetical protein
MKKYCKNCIHDFGVNGCSKDRKVNDYNNITGKYRYSYSSNIKNKNNDCEDYERHSSMFENIFIVIFTWFILPYIAKYPMLSNSYIQTTITVIFCFLNSYVIYSIFQYDITEHIEKRKAIKRYRDK